MVRKDPGRTITFELLTKNIDIRFSIQWYSAGRRLTIENHEVPSVLISAISTESNPGDDPRAAARDRTSVQQ
jgi:hypothetical protein